MLQRTRSRYRATAFAALTSATLLLSACQGGTGQGPTATPVTPTATIAPSPTIVLPTPTPAPPVGLVTRREDVKLATIQLRSKGNFIAPGELQGQSMAGSGSGFIIDPSGIAVTNNHVVTGAALIEVYVAGETRPRNARVLGVSECSDLAVIQIEGSDFQYLDWYDGDIAVGMSVFAAGYPLGDPEFTMNGGVVSKERADGNSTWAAVERVIEHDATIRPGNSGGPLVTDAGEVVAINYAAVEGGPYYAIGRDEALAVIEALRAGEDVTSLGLNGQAIQGEGFSGIWVWSVKSGSPLGNAGVKPGDFITHLEGLEMATDGTMDDYCQILRSRSASDVLSIQVFRPDTEQFLEGQVNGRQLEVMAEATPTPEPRAAQRWGVIEPGQIDVTEARTRVEAARSAYRQLDFETFDRPGITRRTWPEDADSILRDNFYRLIVREPNRLRDAYWRPSGNERTLGESYLIEVDVAFDTRGATGGVGISFDGQGNGDGLSFFIRSDNTWQIVGYINGRVDEVYTSEPVPTTAIRDGINQVRVWRTPEGASFWINNTPVGVLDAGPFSGGLVGIAALSGADVREPITLIADNFRVLER